MEKIRKILNNISPVKKAVTLGVLAFGPVSGENTPLKDIEVLAEAQKHQTEVVLENSTEATTDSTKSSIEWVVDSTKADSTESSKEDHGHQETVEILSPEIIGYVLDTSQSRVTSDYGMRIHPVSKKDKLHDGLDFSAKEGTRVKALGEEMKVIVVSHWDSVSAAGNYIKLETADGSRRVTYMHLSEIQTEVGKTIPKGGIVALSGSTGVGTAAHLHIKVEKRVVLKDGTVTYVSEDPKIFLNEIDAEKKAAKRTEEWKETAVNVTRDRLQLP